jgi:hypothetical protein
LQKSGTGNSEQGTAADKTQHLQEELAVENVPEAVNINLEELRSRLDELPRECDIFVVCRSVFDDRQSRSRLLSAIRHSISINCSHFNFKTHKTHEISHQIPANDFNDRRPN